MHPGRIVGITDIPQGRAAQPRGLTRSGVTKPLIAAATFVAALVSIGAIPVARAAGPAGVNGKIAFTRDDPTTESQRTYVIDPDGTHETQISADAGCPGWSPNSEKLLVCTFNEAGFLRPAISDPDGSNLTLLDAYPHRELHLRCGSWSPAGDRFLCTSDDEDRASTNGIYTLRSTDGGDLVRVTSAPEGLSDLPVGYSPDGSTILFLRNDSNGNWGDLFVVRPDGTGMVRLNPPGLTAAGSNFDGDFGFDSCCGPAADWSPDGSRIAFGARWRDVTGKPTPFAVYVVKPDGGGLDRITPLGIGAGRNHVRWSPDGQRIAFATRRGAVHLPEVWVVRPDGTGLKELTKPVHLDMSVGPVSPDSSQLVFPSYHPEINGGQTDLWIIDADGSGLHRLTDAVEGMVGAANAAWGSAPSI
jgi:Tol biopolymer transport system component